MREGEREEQRPLACNIKKTTEEIKSGTSGCRLFVVPYFQPATSTDCLHVFWADFHLITETAVYMNV